MCVWGRLLQITNGTYTITFSTSFSDRGRIFSLASITQALAGIGLYDLQIQSVTIKIVNSPTTDNIDWLAFGY